MKNTKKIHIIVKYFYPVAAGIETNIMETYSVMANKGWDITVHTSTNTLTNKNILKAHESIRKLKVKRYQFKLFGFFPKIPWKNTHLVCLHNFDIFPHFNILIYSLFLKLLGAKRYSLILTPHGGFNPSWPTFSFTQKIIKKFYHYTIGRLLINAVVDSVRAVSEWERQEMVKHGLNPNIITVISNGIEDTALADVEEKASDHIRKTVRRLGDYIIQIGRIYPIKNYETTIKAMALVPSHIKYVIAGPIGDFKYYQKLLKLRHELGLDKRVVFHGVIRGADKFYLIKHARMMVHMAIWESFCNVVHEGMSQGLVCIVANNTALPLLIRHKVNGYCINTSDTSMVAEKINYVLEQWDNQVIQQIRQNNILYGRQHSWRQVSLRMDEHYNAVMASQKYGFIAFDFSKLQKYKI